MHVQIGLTSDRISIEPVSACLAGLSILLEGLDAYESATTGSARVDGHASDV
jgi:hypothetical protein